MDNIMRLLYIRFLASYLFPDVYFEGKLSERSLFNLFCNERGVKK